VVLRKKLTEGKTEVDVGALKTEGEQGKGTRDTSDGDPGKIKR